jgi:hypothetical protein
MKKMYALLSLTVVFTSFSDPAQDREMIRIGVTQIVRS